VVEGKSTKRGELIMRIRTTLLAAPLLLLGLAACGQPARPAAAPATTVKVSQTDLGPVLTDQTGRALYAFTKDKEKPAACDADCVAVWPAVAGDEAAAGVGANGSLLGKTAPAGGAAQATYNGWPLYYYVGDSVAGDLNGAGVDDEWFPVSPAGALVKKQA
jgi:predicted lipoprotein with Yx(FWY)xxD motif